MANNFRKFVDGIEMVPKTTSTADSAGDIDFDTTNNKLNLHDGSTSSPFVTETQAAQGTHRLKNKDLEDSSTKIVDASDTTKKIAFDAGGTTGTTSTITGAQTANRTLTLPDITDTLISRTSTDQSANRLQNKHLDDDSVLFVDSADTTKRVEFEVSGNTTGVTTTIATSSTTNETITLPAGGGSIVTRTSTDTGANRLQNKDLDDDSVKFVDSGDTTKAVEFEVSGSTTGTTTTLATSSTTSKTLTLPNITDTLITRTSTDQGANRLKNKDLNDADVVFVDSADTTKKLLFDVGGTTGTITNVVTAPTTTRTLTLPDADDTLVGKATTDVFTNKSFNQDVVASTSGTRDVGTSAVNFRNTYLSSFMDNGQISTPSNPASNRDRLYFKSDNNLYSLDSSGNEKLIGSGSSLSTNFIGLSTGFQPVNTNDKDAEASVGNWAAYADAAGSAPVDMTGGSPTVTIARTTTAGEVLNGAGSFKVVKDAANRQGEGASVLTNIPVGYRGKPAAISLPFKIISGSLVSGDLKVYIYDVTNSAVITPFNNDVIYTSSLKMTWNVPSNCTQIRFGFHFASTSTTAVTFSFDDVFVGPQDVSFGPAMTDWIDEASAFTFTGWGTVSASKIYTRRIGDSLYVLGWATTGTVTAATSTINLPAKYVIDTSKIATATNAQRVGFVHPMRSAGGTVNNNIEYVSGNAVAFFDGSDTGKIFVARSVGATGNQYSKENASSQFNNTEIVGFEFHIPIVGWSSESVTGTSSVFRISDLLATGTRVTGTAPTVLGQYRSYLRNAGARSYTETNGSPATSPSSANGIVLYQGNAFSAADDNNNPTKYEIFVGKNKYVKWDWYTTAGRTGGLDVDYNGSTATNSIGYLYSYDPTTGIASVYTQTSVTSFTAQFSGSQQTDGDAFSGDGYFDVIVSENPQTVQQASNPSMRYYASASSISGSLATVTYSTKDFDTDSAYSSGVYTIPVTGKYQVNAAILVTGTIILNNTLILELQKNSSVISRTTEFAGGAMTDMKAVLSDIINCVAGDTLRIQVSSGATTPSIVSSNFDNYLSLSRLS